MFAPLFTDAWPLFSMFIILIATIIFLLVDEVRHYLRTRRHVPFVRGQLTTGVLPPMLAWRAERMGQPSTYISDRSLRP